MKVRVTRLLASTALSIAFQLAHSQWSAFSLRPFAPGDSGVLGLDATQQVGTIRTDVDRAALWMGSPGTYIDMHPVGASRSQAKDVESGRQVGSVDIRGMTRASLWSGSSASWVDLSPSGSTLSIAHGMDSVNQVGTAIFPGGGDKAALWAGNAGSFVSLHPPGASHSQAFGVRGGAQVGYASFGADHAALWHGTASSCVDLNPVGASSSYAFGVWGDVQGGRATFGGIVHAGIWTGSAASWIDLAPPFATYSEVNAVSGSYQVGTVLAPGVQHAVLWQGTVNSMVDLNDFLPPGYSSSVATGVWSDENGLWVSGWSWNQGHAEAMLWRRMPPTSFSPTSYTLVHGIPRGGGLNSLSAADDDRLRVRMNFETGRLAPKVIVDSTFATSWASASRLDLTMETSTTGAPIVQGVSLWNGTAWVQVDSVTASTTDVERTIAVTVGAGTYVVGGHVKVRVHYFTVDRENQSRAEARIDLLRVKLTP